MGKLDISSSVIGKGIKTVTDFSSLKSASTLRMFPVGYFSTKVK